MPATINAPAHLQRESRLSIAKPHLAAECLPPAIFVSPDK